MHRINLSRGFAIQNEVINMGQTYADTHFYFARCRLLIVIGELTCLHIELTAIYANLLT